MFSNRLSGWSGGHRTSQFAFKFHWQRSHIAATQQHNNCHNNAATMLPLHRHNNNNSNSCLPLSLLKGAALSWAGFVWRLTAALCLCPLLLALWPTAIEAANEDVLSPATTTPAENAYAEPHFAGPPQRNVIVQLHDWRLADVAEECRRSLGPSGYAGVQISPLTEHLLYEEEADTTTTTTTRSPRWASRYLPISYSIASNLGDMADLRAATQACNTLGVRVYVVVVLNHMAAGGDPTVANSSDAAVLLGSATGVANAATLDYPDVPYTAADFHDACERDLPGGMGDKQEAAYFDAHELRNCRWAPSAADLDQSRARVRERLVELLNRLVDAGVAGFCVHAAEHMWPADLKAIYDDVKDLNSVEHGFPASARPLFYMDVNDVRYGQWVSKTEYTAYGLVTDYHYAEQLHALLAQRQLAALINWGPALGFVQHRQAVVFVDDMWRQRSAQPGVGHWQRRRHILASAFMLAHPYGRLKLLMSSYAFERRTAERGAPATSPDYDEAAQCNAASGWICEHRWPELVGMVALANSLDDEQDGMINFQTNGPQQIAFCRGRSAFIAFNMDAQRAFVADVHTCLAAGVYCDVISGGRADDGSGCRGRSVVVGEEGVARIEVPPLNDEVRSVWDVDVNWDEDSVLAIYDESMLTGSGEEGEKSEGKEKDEWELVPVDDAETEAESSEEQKAETPEEAVVDDGNELEENEPTDASGDEQQATNDEKETAVQAAEEPDNVNELTAQAEAEEEHTTRQVAGDIEAEAKHRRRK